MSYGLSEKDWKNLRGQIAKQACTPFIGPGVNRGLIQSRSEVADDWVEEYKFPAISKHNIASVAQFLATKYGLTYPKDELIWQINDKGSLDFKSEGLPHLALADLALPIYITTNYDDFMAQALAYRGRKPQKAIYRWGDGDDFQDPLFSLDMDYEPSIDSPLVFHLHGNYQVKESLVITEDDYLNFLINFSKDRLPGQLQKALPGTSYLFLGYNHPNDWDFLMLFKGLIVADIPGATQINVTAQLPQASEGFSVDEVQDYVDVYLRKVDTRMRVFNGTCHAFLSELLKKPDEIGETGLTPEKIDTVTLRLNMCEDFKTDELVKLCADLNVDDEEIEGRYQPKSRFVTGLVHYMQRRGRLEELVEQCEKERPNRSWR